MIYQQDCLSVMIREDPVLIPKEEIDTDAVARMAFTMEL